MVTATLTAEGYKEATTTFEVEVIKAIESIAVETAPTTISYKAGDFFDPTGLVITATYSDATTEDFDYAGNKDSFTFAPSLETALTQDVTSVTITYAGKETTQDISVRALYTYNITWKANGEEYTKTQVTEGDALALPETNPANVGDMAFQGWINMENYYDAEIAPEYIVPEEIIPTEAMTFYAVYAKATTEFQEKDVTYTFTSKSWADATSSWTSGKDGSQYTTNQGVQVTTGATGANATSKSAFTEVTKVVVNYCTNASNGKGSIFVKVGEGTAQTYSISAPSSGGTTLRDTDDMIFENETGNVNITVECATNSIYINSITITSKVGEETTSNFCTTVTSITENTTISENTVWDGNYTINGNVVTIGSDAVLTVNGTLVNTNPANLIVEDGAQLVFNNTGVLATMKKNINCNTSKESDVNWYTISSPLAANTEFANVTNLIPTTVTATDYDLYYLDEKNAQWINSRIYSDTTTIIANPDFTTIDKGRGYIYHNNADTKLEFKGEINVANVECTLTSGAAHGFNLIGNPFTQNIKLADVTGVTLADGFYVLTNQNTLGTEPMTGEIKPLQGFLVQATEEGGTARISKNASVRGERSNERNTNIELIVSNASFKDNAYAMFGEGIGLNKVSHRNAQAPMLYIPQGNEDFAIAFMNENTTVFPVSFKAMTTGSYSISLKATDDINTLVLVDNMTGTETNMLLEDSYSFIGSPADNGNRFTVKLGISHSNGQSDSEHFVYQSGNELVINGEGTLQIFDVLGRVVISEEVHGQTVNVGNLSTGAYIVRLTGESVMTQKIVVR